MGKLITMQKVSEITLMKKSTIYTYVARKKIPYLRLGGKLLFDEQDILKWLESKKVDPIHFD